MKIKTLFSGVMALALVLGAFLAPAASQASPLAGTVSGTVLYSGVHDTNHEVLVAAHLDPGSEPQAVVHIAGPGAYSLADIPPLKSNMVQRAPVVPMSIPAKYFAI